MARLADSLAHVCGLDVSLRLLGWHVGVGGGP